MQGVIYVARGSDYYDLAEQSVKSLKEHNPELSVDIFTDQIDSIGLFDRVMSIPDGPTPKLASLPQSRFSRTLYLDCDTLVLAPFEDMFQLLDRFDLAVAHDVRRTSSLIRAGWQVETPYAFPQMNAGVMLYSARPKMRQFLLDWQTAYVKAGMERDQITLRDLLWSTGLSFYVLPEEFNLRRTTHLDAWEPLDVRPTIIHSHRLLQHLRTDAERLCDIDSIILAERIALEDEWKAVMGDEVVERCRSPVAWFHYAERVANELQPARGTLPSAERPAEVTIERGQYHER